MFDFAWPWVALLAPLPWLARRLLPASDSGEAALKVSFLPELRALDGRRAGIGLPGWRQQLPYLLIWVLLLGAAARPQWLGEPLPQPTTGRDLLLAVDVSGSMDYPDMRWGEESISRLELVKRLLGDFLEARQGDRVGLILFGSQAYLQAPLTFDRQTVRIWLDEAMVGIAGGNTAIGDAIGLAVKRLRERPVDSRVLILVTDGASNGGTLEPMVAAELAATEGVRIHTIGIGAAPEDAGLLSDFGFSAGVELDETTLRLVADRTGGAYFRADSPERLREVGEALERLEPAAQRATTTRVTVALHAWPLAAALLLSVALVLRRLQGHRTLLRWLRSAR